MMWIDIGVIVLLTLRIALCRPALPQLSDPNNDVSLPGGEKRNSRSATSLLWRSERTFSRKSSSGNSRAFAIAYSCHS
jgi:hypothetical protein